MDALFSMHDDEIPASGEEALQHLVKLETEGDYPVLYALVRCNSDSLTLQVTDAKNSWTGTLPHSHISKAAEKAKTSETELLADTRRALTRCDMGTTNYIYTTSKRAGGGLELTWKKHLVSGNIKVQLGQLALGVQPTPGILEKMLDCAVRRLDNQRQSIGELKIEIERLVGERASALKQLEKTVLLKETIESELYRKFTCVLNEKKAKIRRLMESLDNLSRQTAQTRIRGKDGESDGTSDEEDSDDDIQAPSPKMVSLHSKEPIPPSDPGPSSLLQEDWKECGASPPVKRRRRREAKKQAGMPSIPRPPSICSTASISGERKVTRSFVASEGESRKSTEDSLGSQDLLKLL